MGLEHLRKVSTHVSLRRLTWAKTFCYILIFCIRRLFKHLFSHRLRNKFLQFILISRFCFLGTTPVLAPNVWANEKIPKLTTTPGNRTRDLNIARPTLYLTTVSCLTKLILWVLN